MSPFSPRRRGSEKIFTIFSPVPHHVCCTMSRHRDIILCSIGFTAKFRSPLRPHPLPARLVLYRIPCLSPIENSSDFSTAVSSESPFSVPRRPAAHSTEPRFLSPSRALKVFFFSQVALQVASSAPSPPTGDSRTVSPGLARRRRSPLSFVFCRPSATLPRRGLPPMIWYFTAIIR